MSDNSDTADASAAPLLVETEQLKHYTNPAALAGIFAGSELGGVMRTQPADFCVTELSDHQLSGSGEHIWLRVRKTGQNTAWVAKQLAAFAGVESKAVGYAGLKDRHAVTEQWFSIWMPGKTDPDWSDFAVEGVELLESTRHTAKLRTGDLTGNHFSLTIRELCGDRNELAQRLARLAKSGVPNYFGEQRFGIAGGNLDLFEAMGRRVRLARNKKSFALSAARSSMFNAYLNQRVADDTWNQCCDDDVPLSDRDGGLNAWVALSEVAGESPHPTGALWGEGGGRLSSGEADFYAGFPEAAALLERLHVKQHRRSLWLPVSKLEHSIEADVLRLSFSLPPGAFATAVVAALLK